MISMASIRAKLLETRVNDLGQFHVKRFLVGWSEGDIATLKRLRIDEGRRIAEVATIMGRSHRAVREKLSRLGWVGPYTRRARVDWPTLDADLIRLHGEGFWVDDIAAQLKLEPILVQRRGYRLGLSWRGQGAL